MRLRIFLYFNIKVLNYSYSKQRQDDHCQNIFPLLQVLVRKDEVHHHIFLKCETCMLHYLNSKQRQDDLYQIISL